MAAAIKAVGEERITIGKAAIEFCVPKATLWRRLRGVNKLTAIGNKKDLGSIRPVFNEAQEKEIVNHILEMEQRLFGLTSKDVRYIAYQLAERNGIKHPFNKEKELAGKDWLIGFMERHKSLSLRTPEATSATRAKSFNREAVENFFNLLETACDKSKFQPARIYNCDETAITTVQTKPSKVIAARGKSQVGCLTSAERGILATAVICMSAAGSYVPPFIIFPRVRMKAELQDGAPPGTAFACDKSGWMQTHIFTAWFQHFLSHTKPTAEDPVLLLLDGHATHVKNIEVITLALDNHVTMLIFPPHCTHKMQPLDVSFMKPLKCYYTQAIEKFLRCNPGRVVTVYQLSRLFGEAYLKAATMPTAINGFAKTGIYPLDRHIFSEADFAACGTTYQNTDDSTTSQNTMEVPGDTPSDNTRFDVTTSTSCVDESTTPVLMQEGSYQIIDLNINSESFKTCGPSDNNAPLENHVTYFVDPNEVSATIVISQSNPSCWPSNNKPSSVFPVPRLKHTTSQKKSSNPGCATVLTTPEYREKLSSSSSIKRTTCKGTSTKRPALKRPKVSKASLNDDKENEDAACIYCNELFSLSRRGEGWIKCTQCFQWAHEACVGAEGAAVFVCELCI